MSAERLSNIARDHKSKFVLAPALKGDVWMDAADVSILIGKSVSQLAAMRRRGTGPQCEQHGRYWAYRPDAVIEWLNARSDVSMEASHEA